MAEEVELKAPERPRKGAPLDPKALGLKGVSARKCQHLMDLLKHYQDRVQQFDSDRHDFLEKVQAFDGTRPIHHRLKWLIQKQEEDMAELQHELSEAKMALFEEREGMAKLRNEFDEIHIKEMEARKRIQHLLALTQPVSQEVTYFHNRPPEVITRKLVAQDVNELPPLALPQQEPQPQPQKKTVPVRNRIPSKKKKRVAVTGQSARDPHVIRTVYMPSESVEALKAVIDSLKRQLEETSSGTEERFEALKAELANKDAYIAAQRERHDNAMSVLEDQLHEHLNLHRATSKDYLLLKHEAQTECTRLREENGRLQTENEQLLQFADKLEGAAKKYGQKLRRTTSRKTHDEMERLRTEAMSTGQELNVIRERFSTAQSQSEKKIRKLEGSLCKWKTRCKGVEKRRQLEMEGYRTDIAHLRKQLKLLETLLVHIKQAQLVSAEVTSEDVVAGVDGLAQIQSELESLATKLGLVCG